MQFLVKRCVRNQIIFVVAGLLLAVALVFALAKIMHVERLIDEPAATNVVEHQPPTPAHVENHKRAVTAYLAAKYKQSTAAVSSYVELAWKEAGKHPDVPPELVLAIMTKESSLDRKARSNYGAEGLMQVVRRCHPEKLNKRESLMDPKVNVRVGTRILQQYISEKGEVAEALVKYSGNATEYANKVLKETATLQAI